MRTGYRIKIGLGGRRAGRVVVLLASLVTVTSALVLSTAATAGAMGSFGPHGGAASSLSGAPPAPGHAHPSTTGAPLTQAIVTVTALASGNATVFTMGSVVPTCGATGIICTTFSDGTNGGRFNFSPPAGSSLTPGALFAGGSLNVTMGPATCGTNPSDSTAVELDQYTAAASAVTTLAVQFDCTSSTTDIAGTIAFNIVPTDPGAGYYIFGQAGELTGFGNDNYLVYLDGAMYYNLNAPIVGMAPTPDGDGYWMVGSDGGVYASGDAQFYGSTGNLHLNKPVVGMAATPDGKGYWFVASDGGIFNYGDAQFYGSTGSMHLNKPIVGMASTPSGHGYWLVASDGGIFAYGDAQFYGSTGSIHLNKPVVGMASTPSGHGYWFVASDGGIFAYGDAQFYGSTGSIHLNEPIVGMTPTPDGGGYWFTASDGGVFNYGSAGFAGSLGGTGITDVAGMSLGM